MHNPVARRTIPRPRRIPRPLADRRRAGLAGRFVPVIQYRLAGPGPLRCSVPACAAGTRPGPMT